MSPPIDDETVEFLKRTPPPRDLDAAPELPHSGYLAMPADSDPATWNSLADFEKDLQRGINFEDWAQLEVEREE